MAFWAFLATVSVRVRRAALRPVDIIYGFLPSLFFLIVPAK
jgi:hypothetical protein